MTVDLIKIIALANLTNIQKVELAKRLILNVAVDAHSCILDDIQEDLDDYLRDEKLEF